MIELEAVEAIDFCVTCDRSSECKNSGFILNRWEVINHGKVCFAVKILENVSFFIKKPWKSVFCGEKFSFAPQICGEKYIFAPQNYF